MAKLHFNLDNKKYMLEFLPGNQVKIIQPDNKDKFIAVQYLKNTKVMDFMKYIKSLDFSGCKIKHYVQLEGKNCRVSQAEKGV